jgi:hypothetical protein
LYIIHMLQAIGDRAVGTGIMYKQIHLCIPTSIYVSTYIYILQVIGDRAVGTSNKTEGSLAAALAPIQVCTVNFL